MLPPFPTIPSPLRCCCPWRRRAASRWPSKSAPCEACSQACAAAAMGWPPPTWQTFNGSSSDTLRSRCCLGGGAAHVRAHSEEKKARACARAGHCQGKLFRIKKLTLLSLSLSLSLSLRRRHQIKWLATFLSRTNQHEACVLANKFRNLHLYGCWW
jgi:hypothetical protein